ncbi:MAG: hypothetical protein AAGG01_02140, partial [Planctomycetota bacterium]
MVPRTVEALGLTRTGLEFAVTPSGLEVRCRTQPDGWILDLYTYGLSPLGAPSEVPAAEPSQSLEGIEVQREGFRQTYVSSSGGIQIQWSLDPVADDAGRAVDGLWLGLRAHGLGAIPAQQGERLTFIDREGVARLGLRHFGVTDASGADLDARLEYGQDGLGVRIEAPGALYPLLVTAELTDESTALSGDEPEGMSLRVIDGQGFPRSGFALMEPGSPLVVEARRSVASAAIGEELALVSLEADRSTTHTERIPAFLPQPLRLDPSGDKTLLEFEIPYENAAQG